MGDRAKFTLEIDAENEAFRLDCGRQIYKILKELAEKVVDMSRFRPLYIPVMDINGNKVGEFNYEPANLPEPPPFKWIRFDLFKPTKDGLYMISWDENQQRQAKWDNGEERFIDPYSDGQMFQNPTYWMRILGPKDIDDAVSN
jgi:hypothetical protein